MRPGSSLVSSRVSWHAWKFVAWAPLCVLHGCSARHGAQALESTARVTERGPTASSSQRRSSAPFDPAQELGGLLPNEASRCVIARPGPLVEPVRLLMGLVSQADRLPWALDIPVLAYARADVTLADERNVRVDYLRFVTDDRAAVRRALGEADERELNWGEGTPSCAGELTCVTVGAEFVDAHTVRLATGPLPEDFEFEVGQGRCARMLREFPDAVEVSARQGAGLFDSRELVGSESALFVGTHAIERLSRRHFLSPALAARAARKLATGAEDGALFAGIPLRSSYSVDQAVLEQRSEQSLEELWLNVEDQNRLQRALLAERTIEEGAIDPAESFERVTPERILSHVEQALLKLPLTQPAREAELRRLERMLTRARIEAPTHDGLARRHFDLRARFLGDGRGALELADSRLAAGGERAFWQLARRTALARFDVHRLGLELQRAYSMSAADASRSALELAQQVQAGVDYERAEWALVTAHSLFAKARGSKRARVPEIRWPLELLPRLFAYWARLGKAGEGRDLGIHLVAFGVRGQGGISADPQHWAQDTKVQGRDASVFAATTWEDEALMTQGRALAQHFVAGPFELLVGVEQLDVPKRGALVQLVGRLEGPDLVIEELTGALAHVHWDVFMRGLVDPLHALRGSVFPPDELVLNTQSSSEADTARRAAESAGDLVCSQEGLALHCRGGVGDVRAASRGLLRTARAMLGSDANTLWSAHD